MNAKQNLVTDIDGKRFCYHIPQSAYEPGKGWRVSVIIEGESGHYPTGTEDKAPWYWGESYAEAEQTAAEMNQSMGLSPSDVVKIITSSMGGPGKRRSKRSTHL